MPGAPGSSQRGPSGVKTLEVDAVRDDVPRGRRRRRASRYIVADVARSAPTSRRRSRCRRLDPLGRDGAELPRLDHGQPADGRRAKSGGHWWRTSTSGGCGSAGPSPAACVPALERDPSDRPPGGRTDLAVDVGEARRVEAGRRASARRPARAGVPRRGALAGVVAPPARRRRSANARGAAMPACSRSSRPGSPARRSSCGPGRRRRGRRRAGR